MMTAMTCTKPCEYRQKLRQPGEQFDVDERDVRTMEVLGRAKIVDEVVAKPEKTSAPVDGEYLTRDMTAAPPAEYKTRQAKATPSAKHPPVKRAPAKRKVTRK